MAGTIIQKKGFYSFRFGNGHLYKISIKEKRFCELYLQLNGNGAKAAFEIYDCKNVRVAAAVASENLTKPNIIAYINLKLEENGFNDENVKKQHLFMLNQFSDLSAKNKAIETYYKITGKYKEPKVEVNIWKDWTTEELQRYAVEGIVPERFKNQD